MQPRTETDQQEKLPFPKWWPVVAGAGSGLILRWFYSGGPDGPYGAMMGSFIFIAPLVVSAITVYLAERLARRSWGYYMLVGCVANALFITGTLLVNLEGLICAIVIMPLFIVIGLVGALIMGGVCRMTNWPQQAAYSIAVLPMILGAIEPTDGLPMRLRTIERSVTIEAPRDVVWEHLMNVRDIHDEEVEDGLAFRIGVPPPLSALSEDVDGVPTRRISMGKHVYFDQIEAERREHEFIRWTQRFYPDSFPPGAFDQHVVMGGSYFDIDSISYSLNAEGEATRLTLSMHYRVSTRFNWYADGVARVVLGNLEEVLLGVYRRRSEVTGA